MKVQMLLTIVLIYFQLPFRCAIPPRITDSRYNNLPWASLIPAEAEEKEKPSKETLSLFNTSGTKSGEGILKGLPKVSITAENREVLKNTTAHNSKNVPTSHRNFNKLRNIVQMQHRIKREKVNDDYILTQAYTLEPTTAKKKEKAHRRYFELFENGRKKLHEPYKTVSELPSAVQFISKYTADSSDKSTTALIPNFGPIQASIIKKVAESETTLPNFHESTTGDNVSEDTKHAILATNSPIADIIYLTTATHQQTDGRKPSKKRIKGDRKAKRLEKILKNQPSAVVHSELSTAEPTKKETTDDSTKYSVLETLREMKSPTEATISPSTETSTTLKKNLDANETVGIDRSMSFIAWTEPIPTVIGRTSYGVRSATITAETAEYEETTSQSATTTTGDCSTHKAESNAAPRLRPKIPFGFLKMPPVRVFPLTRGVSKFRELIGNYSSSEVEERKEDAVDKKVEEDRKAEKLEDEEPLKDKLKVNHNKTEGKDDKLVRKDAVDKKVEEDRKAEKLEDEEPLKDKLKVNRNKTEGKDDKSVQNDAEDKKVEDRKAEKLGDEEPLKDKLKENHKNTEEKNGKLVQKGEKAAEEKKENVEQRKDVEEKKKGGETKGETHEKHQKKEIEHEEKEQEGDNDNIKEKEEGKVEGDAGEEKEVQQAESDKKTKNKKEEEENGSNGTLWIW